MNKVISIDHGNQQIKTINHIFSASFIEGSYQLGIGADVLSYNGKTYTLSDESLPVQNDKTQDDRYFILTLFALGKELASDAAKLEMADKLRKHIKHSPPDTINVEVLVGLPLQHFETHKKRFKKYFYNPDTEQPIIQFEFNKTPMRVRIVKATVYPQGYAAAFTVADRLQGSRIVNIVDIGGYTVDCLQMDNFVPDATRCTSLYWGIMPLFESINSQVRASGRNNIKDIIIEDILKKDKAALADYSEKRIALIHSAAQAHANRMVAEIAAKGFDLEEDRTVFMGGGALLMKDYIVDTGKVLKPLFIHDILGSESDDPEAICVKANAIGYMSLFELQSGRKST